ADPGPRRPRAADRLRAASPALPGGPGPRGTARAARRRRPGHPRPAGHRRGPPRSPPTHHRHHPGAPPPTTRPPPVGLIPTPPGAPPPMTGSPPVGLIAILRGLPPSEAPVIGDALYQAGIRRLEVPLTSPEPLESIRLLVERLPADALVGAGTVVVPADVDRVHEAGGRMVVAPNTDPAVITRTVELG